MKLKTLLLTLSWLALNTLAYAQDRPFYLKDGDRVVLYGDSITDQRLYTTYAETFVLTRFPQLHVTFVHSGWGGDRVSGGGGGGIDLRLKRDVFAYNPTVMTIMLGMNDGSYRTFDEQIFDRYRRGYEHIIESLKEHLPELRLTLIQPSPFDDVTQPPRFPGGYNEVLVRYGKFVADLARQQHQQVADLNTAIVAALEKAKATDADLAKKVIPDRVHPGPSGHLLMAAELMKAWNLSPMVSAVELDAGAPRVARAQGAQVTDLKADGSLSWTETDEALPMAVDLDDSTMALALHSSDFFATVDQQLLKVADLSAAKYEVRIDGEAVGQFTKEQLAEGVNLARLATPMVKQARKVHELTRRHNDIHFTRWRQVQVPLANDKFPAVVAAVQNLMEALDKEEAVVVDEQRAAAQPKPHRFELVAQ